MTDFRIDRIDPGDKGKIVSSETTRILNRLLEIDLRVIEGECNKVANMYRSRWNAKNPNDHMIEEYLPNLTYKDGIKELYPDFLLTAPSIAPSIIHIQILDLYADALNSKYAANHDAAAGILPHPTDPTGIRIITGDSS